MTESKICTCPSGDGSLVHPCPAHPAVEQVGGDERAAFELFVRKHCGMPAHIAVNWDAKFTNDAWEGWQARAALAQRSEFHQHLKECADEVATWPSYKREALTQPSPAQAEQAEAERPAVVGYRSMESGMVYDQDYGLKDPEALTTVAECERIVGVLRAEIAEWQEAAGRSRSDVVAYIAERAKLLEERDAALARVAELERQVPVATVARVPGEDWNGLHFYRDLQGIPSGTKLYTAPVAQAQHSVPGISCVMLRGIAGFVTSSSTSPSRPRTVTPESVAAQPACPAGSKPFVGRCCD